MNFNHILSLFSYYILLYFLLKFSFSNPLCSFHIFLFLIVLSSLSNLSCFHKHGLEVIYWSMDNLSMATPLKKLKPLPLASNNCSQTCRERWSLLEPSTNLDNIDAPSLTINIFPAMGLCINHCPSTCTLFINSSLLMFIYCYISFLSQRQEKNGFALIRN